MQKQWLIILISLGLVVFGGYPAAATPFLDNWASNVDGTTIDNGVGAQGDDSLFAGGYGDSGLGTINFTISDPGDHFVGVLVDHEITEPFNSYFNEYGVDNGTPDSRQSWEIDESLYYGDIYWNLLDSDATGSFLDNSSTTDPGTLDDVAMAIGWNFSLDAGEEAVISYLVSDTFSSEIASAFYLVQMDDLNGEALFFTSSLTITTSGGPSVPEPNSMLLLGFGLVGLATIGRKRFVR